MRNCTRLPSLTLLDPAGIRIKGLHKRRQLHLEPRGSGPQSLFQPGRSPIRFLGLQLTDDQADISLTNRFATAKFGWEPRWYNPSLERWLHRISVPTLIMWGKEDKLFPSAYAKRWGEKIPGSRVEIVPECGHVPAVEKPDITAKEIVRLYQGTR